MELKRLYDYYEELVNINKDNAADRARGASIIMQHYGDLEMAETLELLSGQLDFDDNLGANDAIKRTYEQLDKLIADREKHRAHAYIGYLTDDMILKLSGGLVTKPSYSLVTSSFLKNGLFDPAIFGGTGKIPYFDDKNKKYNVMDYYGTGIGHIKLPCRVVSKSNYNTVAFLLNKKCSEIVSLMNYNSVAVLDFDNPDLEFGTVIDLKDYNKFYADKDLLVASGGTAIYEMLAKLNYRDKPERLAFKILPVISPVTRPIAYSRKENVYYSDSINSRYEEVIRRSDRIQHLREMGAPDIILYNECHMLNELVDDLMTFITNQCMKRFRKDNVHNMRAVHDFNQMSLVIRNNNVGMAYIPCEKNGEIESLGIYPATIRVQMMNGSYENMALCDVIEACDNAIMDFESNNMMELPAGVDPDHLPPDLQQESDRIETIHQVMQNTIDDILDGAKREREAFMVRFDSSLNMYALY